MDLVCLDFETYYDKEYSLSKITTEEYIRSDQFECIGVGIKINDQQEDFYCGPDIGRFLNGFDYSNAAILCHNTAFDGAILSWHYGIKPKMWFDTLSMARPLHNVKVGGSLAALAAYYQLGVKGDEVINALGKRKKDFTPEELQRYGMYCMNDVKLTYELFKKLRKGFPISELQVIDQTIRMYTEPQIVLDKTVLSDHLADVQAKKQALLDKLGGHERARSILMSNEKFAGMLRRFGVEPPTKVSPKTGKTAYAFAKTDQEFLDLLEHPTPAVALLVEARLGTKSTIEETRTERLIGVAERGPLPIMLRYYGAHTGRFCLAGDTVITVLRRGVVLSILLPELLPDDLVWDGETYTKHGGLVDQGIREVITYDGITGTPDHRVFCDEVAEAVELRMAQEQGYTVTVARPAPDIGDEALDALAERTWWEA